MIHLVDHRNRLQRTTLTSHSIVTEGTPSAPNLKFHLQSCESSIDDFRSRLRDLGEAQWPLR
ncbi:hypothetical protein K439DRAFT_1640421, partial [Ramaria rubella]